MLHGMTHLLDGRVIVEGRRLPIVDAWFDRDEMRLRYISADLGGWLDRHSALIAAGRLGRPERGDEWPTNLSREEIEAADARIEGHEGGVDVRGLPSILTGPFGNTISPMLIYAGLMAESHDERVPDADTGVVGDARLRTLDRAKDWLRTPVFARDGEVGPLADLLFEPDLLGLTHLVVRHEGLPRAVPIGRLRGRVTGGHMLLDADTAQVAGAPQVVAPQDAPEGWDEDVRGHWREG